VSINLYNKDQFIKIKAAAECAHSILLTLIEACKPGVTTQELEDLADLEIIKHKAEPLFQGYHGYPFCTCLSVNEFIVHGFPNSTPLKAGDVISIDIGIRLNGFCGDNARTIIVGGVESEHSHLIEVTKQAFEAGLAVALPGNTVGHIGNRINNIVSKPYLDPANRSLGKKFKVFHKVFGHGIGHELHEAPNIPNLGFEGAGAVLKPGMCICIEPVVLYNSSEGIIKDSDLYHSVKEFYTSDLKPSAHHENQIFITESGPIVLSKV
jgi:methionyl aminopeptidase